MNTENNSGLRFINSVLDTVEKLHTEHNTILAEVRTHEEQLSKETAALGKLHTRLVAMRNSARELRDNVSGLRTEDVVSYEMKSKTAHVVYELSRSLDDSAWKLVDFREVK